MNSRVVMRIISGSRKGTRLSSTQAAWIRPTADSTKELMFNVLGKSIVDRQVLDLYAGTGNLGIEALSRGAAKAIFVEKNQRAVALIQRNLAKTRFTAQAEIWKLEVEKALRRLNQAGAKFDLIFMDPPYGRGLAAKTLTSLAKKALLTEDGWLIIEHDHKEALDQNTNELILYSCKRKGETKVSFFHYV